MKILLIAPVSHLASINFAHGTVRLLALKGHQIDVLTIDNATTPFIAPYERCRVFSSAVGSSKLDAVLGDIYRFAALVRRRVQEERYDIALALSQKGLVIAGRFVASQGIPVVYMNDEVWFGPECGTWWATRLYSRLWKALERFYNQRVAFSIIQDEGRADLLSQVNRIPRESIMMLPNSPSGCAHRLRTSFLHERLVLPEQSCIVLWIGMVPPYGAAEELVREANRWPEPLKLVFHTRYQADDDVFLAKLKSVADPARVAFSLKPVAFEQVEEVVASASIGLALYPCRGPNAILVGASSGKITSFLRLGIPVIAQNFSSLRWVEQDRCGVCVLDPSEVLTAARTILADYKAYSDSALRVFDERLSFDCALEHILRRLEKLVLGGGANP